MSDNPSPLLSRLGPISSDSDPVTSLLGPEGSLRDHSDPVASGWQLQPVVKWASRIGGGTEQVHPNIVGERVLGPPGDYRVDKDPPFSQAR